MALASLTIQPSAKDTWLSELTPDTEYGANADLLLTDTTDQLSRIILEFSLATLAGKTPVTAIFSLYYYTKALTDPVGKTIWAYKLSRTNWENLQANWNDYKTGTAWTAAGGDYVTSDPSGDDIVFPAGFGWMDFDILDIVTDAYDASDPCELLVKYETEDVAPGQSTAYFYSLEEGVQTTLRPKLVIEYINPPTNVVASKGTVSDKVVITWDKVDGVSEYQVYRDGAGLGWLGDVDTYDDEDADKPVITAGVASASKNKKYNSILLKNSDESIADGTSHTYKVRCRYSGIESEDSDTDTGYKGASTISYQWQRSAADSDAGYADISGLVSKRAFDYTGPDYPAGRYYRCSILAYGSTTVYSAAARGYRRNPALPEIPIIADIIIKDPDGNTLAYLKNVSQPNTDYRTNELAILGFTVPADSDEVAYLIYPNEVWLYVDGELQDIFKIIDTEGIR